MLLKISTFLFVFPRNISKTNAARITKPDIQMFHYGSWKTIYFGVRCKRSRSWVTKTVPACECLLLLVTPVVIVYSSLFLVWFLVLHLGALDRHRVWSCDSC